MSKTNKILNIFLLLFFILLLNENIKAQTKHDLAVKNIKVEREIPLIGVKNKIIIEIKNNGTEIEKNIPVEVKIGDIEIGNRIISKLDPGVTKEIEFEWTPEKKLLNFKPEVNVNVVAVVNEENTQNNQEKKRLKKVQYANTSNLDKIIDAPWRVKSEYTEIPIIIGFKDTDEEPIDLKYIKLYYGKNWDNIDNFNLIPNGTFEPNNFITINQENSWYHIFTGIKPSSLNFSIGEIIRIRVDVKYRNQNGDNWDDIDPESKCLEVFVGNNFPKINNWYYGDTHYHSAYTDNKIEYGGEAEMILKSGIAMDLDWVTVTDHSCDFANEEDFEEIVFNDNNIFKIIKAEEVTIHSGNPIKSERRCHFLVYNSSFIRGPEIIPGTNDTSLLLRSLNAVFNDMDSNAFGFAAHPLSGDSFFFEGFSFDPWHGRVYYTGLYKNAFEDNRFRGLQLWNERNTSGTINVDYDRIMNPFPWDEDESWFETLENGVEEWDELLSVYLDGSRKKIFIEGGSDAHGDFNYTTRRRYQIIPDVIAHNNAFGKVRTAVYCPKGFSEQNILNSLRNGRSVVTDGPIVVFGIDRTGDDDITDKDDIQIGEEYTVSEGSNLSLILKAKNINEFGGNVLNLRILRGTKSTKNDPEEIHWSVWNLQKNEQKVFNLTNYLPSSNQGFNYYRVEVYTPDREFRCYTNPIWISTKPAIAAIADIALILDSSGSMSWNDPNDLRKAAAKHFIDLADEGVQISIVDFDWSVRTWAPLTLIENENDRDILKTAVDKVNSSGGTNLGIGLQRGYDELTKSNSPAAPKAAVLLTNGHGTYSGQADQYAAKGWNVFTVGLSSGVNANLLRDIAYTTPEGEYYPATLGNMQTIYNKIVTKVIGESNIASINGYINKGQEISNNFFISTKDYFSKITANWPGSELDLILTDPEGNIIDQSVASSDPDIEYQKSSTNVIYKINSPTSGEWKSKIIGVDVPSGGEQFNFSVSTKSDIFANFLSFEPTYNPGDVVHIGVRLKEKVSQYIYQPIINATVEAEIVIPDGSVGQLILYDDGNHNDKDPDDGVYANNFDNTNTMGSYLIKVDSHGSFTRKLQETVQVGAFDAIYIAGGSLKPVPGSTIKNNSPEISAIIMGPNSNIDISSIAMTLDGSTVSHSYDDVNQIVSYVPSSSLSNGSHTVTVDVSDDSGNPVPTATWSFNVAAPVIVNNQVMPVIQNVLWDPATQIFAFDVAIQNTGSGALEPSIRAELNNLMPAPPTVIVNNSDGGGDGIGAYWDYSGLLGPDGELTAGEISQSKRWEFYNPDMVGFYFSCDVYAVPATSLPKGTGSEGNAPFAMAADIENQRVTMDRGDVGKVMVPKQFAMEQNYPNPFNPTTTINYQLPEATKVKLIIYNMLGEEIQTLVDGTKHAGYHSVIWDGRDESGKKVGTGMYIYRIKAGEFTDIKKMALIK